MTPQITITLPSGGVFYLTTGQWGWEWQTQGAVTLKEVNKAQQMLDDYDYSPAHGYPGCAIAAQVAKELGGKLSLPPLPEGKEDVIY